MSRWEQQLVSNLPLMSAVAAAAFAMRARLSPAVIGRRSSTHRRESRVGEGLHRGVFRAIAALPGGAPLVIRRGIFDTLFRLESDPWNYDALPYENHKRQELLRVIPPQARTILEVGCAEGHNLRALAARHPQARVIGIDVSERAVEIARDRAAHAGLDIEILHTDIRRGPSILTQHRIPEVDVVVIAETLYYLGSPERIRTELAPLRSCLSPGATVVLLHPIRDARRLHAAALAALGAVSTRRVDIPDGTRPFMIETALITDATA